MIVFLAEFSHRSQNTSVAEEATCLTYFVVDRVNLRFEKHAEASLLAQFFSENILRKSLRRVFPFATFVLINFGESRCEIKVFTKAKKFDGAIAINLLLAALLKSPEQVELVIPF